MAILRATGTQSEILNIYFRDSRSVTTVGMPNVSASSIAFSWCKNNQTAQSSGICSSQTTLGTYSTNSLTQISSTSTLGWYQFCIDNGALVAGRSVVLHLWSATSTAGVTPYSVEIDLLGNIQPVSVSTMTTPVGVSSASVNFGVSTLAVPVGVSSASVNLGVSTLAASVSSVTGAVNVSSASVNFGVSTLAASVSSVTGSVNASSFSRQVGVSSATVDFGVSTIAVAEKLVGVSTVAVSEKLVGVSTIAVGEKLVGVSTIAASQKLVGTSTMTTPVGVSSAGLNFGVSTVAVLVGVSTLAVPVGVSSASVNFGVSTMATPVGVSSFAGSVDVSSASVMLGVSTLTASVDVSSSIVVSSNVAQINGATVQGDGTAGNLWRG